MASQEKTQTSHITLYKKTQCLEIIETPGWPTPSLQFVASQQIDSVLLKLNQVHCLAFLRFGRDEDEWGCGRAAEQEADGCWGQIEVWLFFIYLFIKYVTRLPMKGQLQQGFLNTAEILGRRDP